MNINRDKLYLFRMTNMTDEHKHRYTLLIQDDRSFKTWKMKINTDTHYLFRMTNMEDEDKHMEDEIQLYLFRMTNMEDEHKQIYTLLIQDDKHGRRR